MCRFLTVTSLLHLLALVSCNRHNGVIYQAIPNAFFKDCLSEINKYRKLHGSQPLRWSSDLQYHAQERADKLSKDEILQSEIESLDIVGQGETISYYSPPKQLCRAFPPSGNCHACRETIATWYNESKYYNYNTGYSIDGTKQVLDFTQLVWKDTVKVGLATAISPHYGTIIIARYHPRGNIGFLDDYVRNVAPKGTRGSDGFGGNDGDSSQGGPACRKLKKRKVDEECKNEYEDDICDAYARLDHYCQYNTDFMKKNCAKSCKLCKRRFSFPPKKESKEEKKLELRWEIGKWLECHGGFQRRSLKCFHKFKGRDFLVKNKFCRHELEEQPTEYKDCLFGG